MFAGSELELAVLGAFVGEFEELRDDRSCFVLSKVSAASPLSAGTAVLDSLFDSTGARATGGTGAVGATGVWVLGTGEAAAGTWTARGPLATSFAAVVIVRIC